MSGTDTYHVRLTKVSDNSVVHSFLLAEGRGGAPRLKLGSREKEAAGAGQRGTIVIQSLHGGSGQHVSRDPTMYEIADGMFADEPGQLKKRGKLQHLGTLTVNAPFRAWARGAIVPKATGRFKDWDHILVVPNKIHSVTNGVITEVLDPLTDCVFTGSYAHFGQYTYFGQANRVSGASTYAASYDVDNNAYSNNAGFVASFLAEHGEKLWRGAFDSASPNRQIDVAWSDAPAATPVFTAAYSLKLPGPFFLKDIGAVGPHLILVVPNMGDYRTRLFTLDTAGLFTDLARGLEPAIQLVPYLSGQALWLGGSPAALWIPSVTSFQKVLLDGLPASRAKMVTPWSYDTTEGQFVYSGVGAASLGEELFYSAYGTYKKKDGTEIEGSALLSARLTVDGIQPHTLLTPEGYSYLEDAYVIAQQASYTAIEDGAEEPQRKRILHFMVAAPTANAQQQTLTIHRLDLWDGTLEPNDFDTGQGYLRTSRYSGPSRVTMQAEMIRGYVTKIPGGGDLTVRIYLDGSLTEVSNFTVSSAGPVSQALPTNTIGRDIALDFETSANGSVVVEFPWSIDWFAVPDKKDVVRLPVVAGRDQLTRMGTLTDKTRAEVIDDLANICASPEAWTLEWWDEMPDWTVVPLGYDTVEVEPDHVPGAGAAIAWLNLQRL